MEGDTLQVLAERQEILDDDEQRKALNKSRPAWTKLKAQSARTLAHRMTSRCMDVFDAGIRICHEQFADFKVR